jgi:hypothetical protein
MLGVWVVKGIGFKMRKLVHEPAARADTAAVAGVGEREEEEEEGSGGGRRGNTGEVVGRGGRGDDRLLLSV